MMKYALLGAGVGLIAPLVARALAQAFPENAAGQYGGAMLAGAGAAVALHKLLGL